MSPHFSRHLLPGLCLVTAVSFSAVSMAQVAVPSAPSTQSEAGRARQATAPRLQRMVEKTIKDAGLDATVCVYVADANGRVAADVKGEHLVAPASNNKLITTAAGMTLLGPDYVMETKVYGTAPVKDGRLEGDLVVYGGGDPSISGRYQADKMDVTAIFRAWAKQLKDKGIKTISGNIVADDSWFDDVYFHPNWYPSERAEYYEAEISALSFNDNCIDIAWNSKGQLPDEPTSYTLNPVTSYGKFISEVKNVATGVSTERYYAREATENVITATGTLNVETSKLDSAAIHDGALYAVTVLGEVMAKEGIKVEGKPVKTRGAAEKLSAEQLLFTHKSVSMLQVCQTINLNSQNYFAECVFKTLGKVKGGEGSYTAGSKVVENFSRNSGIWSEGHKAVDGSGLSGLNQTSARQLVSVLQYMDKHELKDKWRSTLPQGQVRGSLKPRFTGVEEAKRIFGKTGSIGGVRSLSGYVIDAAGRDVYYAVVLNDLNNKDIDKGMKLIDQIAVNLAKSK